MGFLTVMPRTALAPLYVVPIQLLKVTLSGRDANNYASLAQAAFVTMIDGNAVAGEIPAAQTGLRQRKQPCRLAQTAPRCRG